MSEKEKILEIMRKNHFTSYLCTCDGKQPDTRMVSPIIQDDLIIWIITFADSNKVKQIKDNPNIALAFMEPPRGEKEAIVYGKAEIIENMETKKKVWDLGGEGLTHYFPDGYQAHPFCPLKIEIDYIKWREDGSHTLNIYKP